VSAQHEVPVLDSEVLDPTASVHPRVVHQHVQAPVLGLHPSHHGPHLLVGANVGFDEPMPSSVP
jgi:hypothetical protein